MSTVRVIYLMLAKYIYTATYALIVCLKQTWHTAFTLPRLLQRVTISYLSLARRLILRILSSLIGHPLCNSTLHHSRTVCNWHPMSEINDLEEMRQTLGYR